MKTTPLILAALAAAALAGCASDAGLKTTAQPQPAPVLGRLADSLPRGEWPRADWWAVFQDTQLARLIDEGLADSPNLQTAASRLKAAQAGVELADGNRGPSVALDADLSRQRFAQHGTTPPPFAGQYANVGRLALDFKYELDLWGKNRALLDAALGQSRAAEAELDSARLILSTAIAQAYFQWQGLLERDRIQADIEQQREAQIAWVQKRIRAGLDTTLASKPGEQDLAAVRATRAQLARDMQLTRHALAALLGKGPERAARLDAPAAQQLAHPTLPDNLPATLLERRPDIVAQRARIAAALGQAEAARAQFKPTVNLTAFLGFTSYRLGELIDAQNRILGGGPALSLPILDSGRLRANLGARYAEADVAVGQYNQTVVDAVRQVADQLATLQTLDDEQKAVDGGVNAARQNLQLTERRLKAGLADRGNLLAAQNQVLAQRGKAVELQDRRLQAELGLIKALGGGYQAPAATNNKG
ncbi:efflux transporter outer membrane subunit [Chitinivorax sp. PXF-14]|uniref:efflux transporter outer membrane subunit n=1 Tax=Chitinivorax sp. PXF-14 TaxID=3230488 RepID=UPI003467DDC6